MAPPWQTRAKSVDRHHASHSANPAQHCIRCARATFEINFSPRQLYGSIARTKALPGASIGVVRALANSAQMLIEQLVDNTPQDFAFTTSVLSFADAMRTSFSGEIGAGITDRYMESLGYVWRDNARSIVPTGQVADFVYDGPPTKRAGVVLAEAKGSITSTVTPNAIATTISNGYRNQVEPHIGTAPGGTTILHGYAIGIGSRPGDPTSHIHVEEPSVVDPAGLADQPLRQAAIRPAGQPVTVIENALTMKKGKDGERTGRPKSRGRLGKLSLRLRAHGSGHSRPCHRFHQVSRRAAKREIATSIFHPREGERRQQLSHRD